MKTLLQETLIIFTPTSHWKQDDHKNWARAASALEGVMMEGAAPDEGKLSFQTTF